jgi:pyruvate dehydrogenase E1 component
MPMSGIFDTPDQNVDQLVDIDPTETAEWQASFDAALEHAGPVRARYLMLKLLQRAHEKQIGLSSLRNTDYINTISPEHEPEFPGDEAIERRIRQYIRWNAAMLVHRAQRPGVGVGGHISTYASSASLYEVGFNHFFRGMDHPGGGDQIFFQGHASPGMYARAFLEGRLSDKQLDGFRQEVSHPGGGLSSYPQQCQWELDQSMRSIKLALIVIYRTVELKIRASNTSGHFLVMVKLMKSILSVQSASLHVKA